MNRDHLTLGIVAVCGLVVLSVCSSPNYLKKTYLQPDQFVYQDSLILVAELNDTVFELTDWGAYIDSTGMYILNPSEDKKTRTEQYTSKLPALRVYAKNVSANPFLIKPPAPLAPASMKDNRLARRAVNLRALDSTMIIYGRSMSTYEELEPTTSWWPDNNVRQLAGDATMVFYDRLNLLDLFQVKSLSPGLYEVTGYYCNRTLLDTLPTVWCGAITSEPITFRIVAP